MTEKEIYNYNLIHSNKEKAYPEKYNNHKYHIHPRFTKIIMKKTYPAPEPRTINVLTCASVFSVSSEANLRRIPGLDILAFPKTIREKLLVTDD